MDYEIKVNDEKTIISNEEMDIKRQEKVLAAYLDSMKKKTDKEN